MTDSKPPISKRERIDRWICVVLVSALLFVIVQRTGILRELWVGWIVPTALGYVLLKIVSGPLPRRILPFASIIALVATVALLLLPRSQGSQLASSPVSKAPPSQGKAEGADSLGEPAAESRSDGKNKSTESHTTAKDLVQVEPDFERDGNTLVIRAPFVPFAYANWSPSDTPRLNCILARPDGTDESTFPIDGRFIDRAARVAEFRYSLSGMEGKTLRLRPGVLTSHDEVPVQVVPSRYKNRAGGSWEVPIDSVGTSTVATAAFR